MKKSSAFTHNDIYVVTIRGSLRLKIYKIFLSLWEVSVYLSMIQYIKLFIWILPNLSHLLGIKNKYLWLKTLAYKIQPSRLMAYFTWEEILRLFMWSCDLYLVNSKSIRKVSAVTWGGGVLSPVNIIQTTLLGPFSLHLPHSILWGFIISEVLWHISFNCHKIFLK